MIKFVTKTVPFDELKPGDLVECHGGYDRLVSVEITPDSRAALTFANQNGYECHTSNWRDVVIGYSKEYQRAYPSDVFQANIQPGE